MPDGEEHSSAPEAREGPKPCAAEERNKAVQSEALWCAVDAKKPAVSWRAIGIALNYH